ncbi:hypothetical protein [Streptomyces sp. CB01881]|uniref:hypothetical protein n=1 Tax=Streptomyces sp. CB01881 TaxID=2078691 RepID=UPI000CDC328A|nr:hypothetical protein [Streptomyces sp. CB01881]AUY50033.1 hypothetical protein C2142_15120 [Streptomyces sp. CB01881]TYC73430.1 hypothetical protein EH183_15105 [Streptomyces sp. CB01881]
MADRESNAQIWGAAVVVASALAVVAAYLINGAALVLAVAGVEVLLLMVYVGRRWRQLHQPATPRGHQSAGATPDAAHCERCRRAHEALDVRRSRSRPRQARPAVPQERAPHERAPYGRQVRDRSAGARPAHRDHPDHDRPDHGRPPRPAPEWTAERAATRSPDRSAARHGVPGSADRAVRHQ